MKKSILARLRRILNFVKVVGVFETIALCFLRFFRGKWPYDLLISEYSRYPLLCRPLSSDFTVFRQVFIIRQYSCLDNLQDVGLVIDCGANVGYSSAYFLSRYTNAYLIAVEPDPGNYSTMAKNLRPYGKRVKMINAAVWSGTTSLAMSEDKYRDGREWSRQVKECRFGEKALISTIEVEDLLKISGKERISILKIDIEGSEAILFSSPNCKRWIDKTDVIAIELHDDSCFGNCSEIFYSAIPKEEFIIAHSGDLTVCMRRQSF